jgi:hypothetical protein
VASGIPWGEQRVVDGRLRVHYDGYWIKAYPIPDDTLSAKKQLIEALTRRLFNHVEHGINTPGHRLEEARVEFEREIEPARKRVKGAMLAGAVFNRATDIFTKLVEIQTLGVEIQPDNALMRECGELLQEAISLGKLVLHRSGEEGIDELWGEPWKAFLYPVDEFYRSRYVKIASAMRCIDRLGDQLLATFTDLPRYEGVVALIADFTQAAKHKSETLRTDPDIFDVWASFIVAGEKLCAFQPAPSEVGDVRALRIDAEAHKLLHDGKDLVMHVTRARVPMPKSTAQFIERCEQFYRAAAPRRATDSPDSQAETIGQ